MMDPPRYVEYSSAVPLASILVAKAFAVPRRLLCSGLASGKLVEYVVPDT